MDFSYSSDYDQPNAEPYVSGNAVYALVGRVRW